MITNDGKMHIKRYLAGFVPSIARSIAFGIGSGAEVVTDTALNFEVSRSNVLLTSFDFDTNKLIYKAVLDSDFAGTIYEVGIFSREDNGAGPYGSRLVASFDAGDETWLNGTTPATYSIGNTRVGTDSVVVAPTASSTITMKMANILMDFSGNSGADKFTFAFNTSTNLSSVRYRFRTDASNYFDFLVSSGFSTGYNIISVPLSSATVTGAPNWGQITSLDVLVTATAGGTATVNLDAIRIEDTDTINPEYVMVSRELLSTPFVKEAGRVQEIEFSLDVNV